MTECQMCKGSGWVCENHLDRPSDVVTIGGCDCGGAARNCFCNPNGHAEFQAVYASIDPDSVKEWVQ